MNKYRLLAIVGVVVALAAAFWWASPRQDAPPASASSAPAAPAEISSVAFALFPPVADRFLTEPCCLIAGGGLFSLGAAMADVRQANADAIGISLGDLTLAEGGIGRRVANYHYTEVFPQTGVKLVAAGEGELGLGVDFLREGLTRTDVTFLCANAVDSKGLVVMRGWQLAKSGGRGILIVAVAADSLQADLVRRGSDIRLSPALKAVADARADASAQAARAGFDVSVFALIVHGTVDEAAAIVEKTPGVTFAAAAHGPTLPTSEPRAVGGVPIFYGGQGLRFVWAVFVPPDGGPVDPALARLGSFALSKGSSYADNLKFFRDQGTPKMYEDVDRTPGDRRQDPRGAYVSAARCGDCHIAVAAEFAASAHARPPAAILASPFCGNTGCINCHETGPYSTGGWKGPSDKMSDMAGVSCEACHGPGEVHAATPKTAHMPKVALSRCYECHLADRSPDFDAAAAWKRCGHKLVR